MRNRLVSSSVVSAIFAATMFAFSLRLLAQTPARPGAGGTSGRPDLSGIWDGDGGRAGLAGPGGSAGGPRESLGGVPAAGFTKEEPTMTASALRIYQARREGRSPNQQGQDERNPSMYPYCMPSGFPRIYNFDPLVEIIQTPNVLYMLFERDHQVRRIYLDGRKHLQGWLRTLMGTSHGRWEGDTLVVETENLLGLEGHAWLDWIGHPHTDALRVTERIRRPAQDTLQIDFTFDDPGAYTKPWTGKKVFRLRTDWDMTDAVFCQEHQVEDYLRDIRNGTPRGRH